MDPQNHFRILSPTSLPAYERESYMRFDSVASYGEMSYIIRKKEGTEPSQWNGLLGCYIELKLLKTPSTAAAINCTQNKLRHLP